MGVMLKEKIIELLEEYSPHELDHLTGEHQTTCLMICHEIIVRDKKLNKPEYWKVEEVDTNLWGIYGDAWGEWIDPKGDFLCFDTPEDAQQYIDEEISKCN